MKSTVKSRKSSTPTTSVTAAPTPAPATAALPSKTTSVPKVKKPAAPVPAPAATVIKAKIDVGFGNVLYVRGDGPGLSWNTGVALTCVDANTWTISIAGAKEPVIFKLLINDVTWSRDSDYTAAPGSTVEVTPTF